MLLGPSRRPLLLTLWWPTYSTSVPLLIPIQPLHLQSSTTHSPSTLWLTMPLVALAYPPLYLYFLANIIHNNLPLPGQTATCPTTCFYLPSMRYTGSSQRRSRFQLLNDYPNGSPSAPTYRSTTCFMTMESLPSKPFRCIYTRFVMDTTPNNIVSG
jgi:hypothetical protein